MRKLSLIRRAYRVELVYHTLDHLKVSIALLADSENIPNQGIDLHAVHVVELLQRLLDLPLVGLDITDENECVVLLDLLHRTLGVQRVNYDLVVVEPGFMRNGFTGILGRTRELEGLWAVEGR